ncbi:MAG: 3'-5' exonuclease [Bacteroidota bacterium]|nr:3'-5' exonuclease [Bacteroidota bacterium]
MFQKQITKEEIYELPLKAFDGEVVVIDFHKDVDRVIPEIMKETMLGFDTETKPSFKKGRSNNNSVSLLQLASAEKAWLFRLNTIGFHSSLAKVLNNENILKIGVAIHDDIKILKALHNFEDRGFIDLQHHVKNFGITSMGLKKLTAIVLNFRISKSQQLSNWENQSLSSGQIKYAATDAWTCLEIYKKLQYMSN